MGAKLRLQLMRTDFYFGCENNKYSNTNYNTKTPSYCHQQEWKRKKTTISKVFLCVAYIDFSAKRLDTDA